MTLESKINILRDVVEYYLNSGDFNGTPIISLKEKYNLDEKGLKNILISLIKEDNILLNFGDRHPNPHIMAFWGETRDIQINN